jgi:hypothetical protein
MKTPHDVLDVPGVAAFLGKGVWLEIPEHLPSCLRDGHAVVIGEAGVVTGAALRLHAEGCRVTVLATGFSAIDVRTVRRAVRGRAGIDIRLDTELACVDGIDHVEALVVRKRGRSCVDACNASAVFILGSELSLQSLDRAPSRALEIGVAVHPSPEHRRDGGAQHDEPHVELFLLGEGAAIPLEKRITSGGPLLEVPPPHALKVVQSQIGPRTLEVDEREVRFAAPHIDEPVAG